MGALSTRLARLEAEVAAMAEREADAWGWLAAAPPAVAAYFEARGREGAHPLAADLAAELRGRVRLGEAPGLRLAQWRLLFDAGCRLTDALLAEGMAATREAAARAVDARLFPGVPASAVGAALLGIGEPEPGASLVRLWRERGTRNPKTLALLGFGVPEMALLAADGAEGGDDGDSAG